MANETEYANFNRVANALSGMAAPAIVANSFLVPLTWAETVPANTLTFDFRKSGALGLPAVTAESTAYTRGAADELTDTKVTATVVKQVLEPGVSVEARKFSPTDAGQERIARETGAAHGRAIDAAIKTLFSSLSSAVTASTTLVKDNLMDARYTVEAALDAAFSGFLVGVISYKQLNDIRKFISDTAAAAFMNQVNLGELLGTAKAGVNSYKGQLFGIDIYATSGLPTGGGDTTGAVFDPTQCFGTVLDAGGPEMVIHQPDGANGLLHLHTSWMFRSVVEVVDQAGVRLNSDS